MRPAQLIPLPRDGRLPVSFTQEERLIAGGSQHVVNNIIVAGLHLRGTLDNDALVATLDALVNRHEVVRSRFRVDDLGGQVILASALTDYFRVRDVPSTVPRSNREAAGLAVLADELSQPFDLSTGPLLRACLVRVADDDHLLGLAVDHIVGDGHSKNVLVRDLLSIYRSQVTGEETDLPELDVQFQDFAMWEREYLTGPTLDRMMSYWRKTLAGTSPIPNIRLTDPAAPGGVGAVDVVRLRFDADTSAHLRALVDAEKVTMFAVMSAATKAAVVSMRLAHPGGGDPWDVALYGSAANRIHREVANVFGYFATPIVFRTRLMAELTLSEVLAQEAKTLFGAMCHQQLPHSLIMKELRPDQYGVRHRFGEDEVPPYLNFDFETKPRHTGAGGNTADLDATPDIPGLAVEKAVIPLTPLPRGGLRVIGREDQHGIALELRYRTDRYSRSWSEQLTASVERFLAEAVDRPSAKLGAVVRSINQVASS
jgi:hypothetical protein